ncbi:MAG: hypothetical protein QHC90_05520 [Shinella sp.]|nr:hypothetical protein [Shinella sp.]
MSSSLASAFIAVDGRKADVLHDIERKAFEFLFGAVKTPRDDRALSHMRKRR